MLSQRGLQSALVASSFLGIASPLACVLISLRFQVSAWRGMRAFRFLLSSCLDGASTCIHFGSGDAALVSCILVARFVFGLPCCFVHGGSLPLPALVHGSDTHSLSNSGTHNLHIQTNKREREEIFKGTNTIWTTGIQFGIKVVVLSVCVVKCCLCECFCCRVCCCCHLYLQ